MRTRKNDTLRTTIRIIKYLETPSNATEIRVQRRVAKTIM